jgi:hypothetical protein
MTNPFTFFADIDQQPSPVFGECVGVSVVLGWEVFLELEEEDPVNNPVMNLTHCEKL